MQLCAGIVLIIEIAHHKTYIQWRTRKLPRMLANKSWAEKVLEKKKLLSSLAFAYSGVSNITHCRFIYFQVKSCSLHLIKIAFFQKVWCIFLIAQKVCRKLSWKRDFEIAFGLESADPDCTAVSKGGKIQNTKLRIEHSTFLGQWK